MSKEKQIEEMAKDLQKSEHWYFNDKSVDFELDRKKTAESLYNAGYRKQSEWISVDERLPEKWEGVLIYCDGRVSTDFISSNGLWYDHDHRCVTHWMPLPEPPKMKGGAD